MKRVQQPTIYVGAKGVSYCMRLAQAASDLGMRIDARKKKVTTYGANSMTHQLVAKLGEFAAWEWAKQNGLRVEAEFTRRNLAADLILYEDDGQQFGVEVKTYKRGSWANYGPEVSANQIDRLRERSKIIVWCLVPDGIMTGCVDVHVAIVGFTRTAQLVKQEMQTRTMKDNPNHLNYLVREKDVEPISLLFELFQFQSSAHGSITGNYQEVP